MADADGGAPVAEEQQTFDFGNTDALADMAKNANTTVLELQSSLEGVATNVNMVAEATSNPALRLGQPHNAMLKYTADTKAARKAIHRLIKDAEKAGGSDFSNMIKGMVEVGGAAKKAAKDMVRSFKANKKNVLKIMGSMSKSIIPLMQQTATLGALKAADNATRIFTKMEKPIKDLEKMSFGLSMSMGKGFRDSSAEGAEFRDKVTESIIETHTSLKELTKVMEAFGAEGVFEAGDLTNELHGLGEGFDELNSTVNLANTAILVSAATGMEATKVVGLMGEAYSTLGAKNINEAATALGTIALSAEKSNLSFTKVSKSIQKGAESLKYWGGTVGSVTPMYDMFASSLEKGRKGLAPELMEKYVSGIANMAFEMKAFVGLAGGAQQGAIGAGLEMEELLSQGAEGMQEVSNKITDMIKEKTGGDILSRKEAVEGGAGAQQQFLMQRKLIQQFTGVRDEGQATAIMDALRKAGGEEPGAQADALKKLGNIMTQGQSVQDRTTGAIEENTQRLEATQLKVGENLLGAITDIVNAVGGKTPTTIRREQKRMARTGRFSVADMSRFVRKLSGGQRTQGIMEKLGVQGTAARQQVSRGQTRAARDIGPIMEKLNASMAAKREAMLKDPSVRNKGQVRRGRVNNRAFAADYQSTIDSFGDKMNSMLQRAGVQSERDLSTQDRAQYNQYKEALDMVKQAMSAKRVDMGRYDKRNTRRLIERAGPQVRTRALRRQMRPGQRVERASRPDERTLITARRQIRDIEKRSGGKIVSGRKGFRPLTARMARRRDRPEEDMMRDTMRVRRETRPPVEQAMQATEAARKEKVELEVVTTPKTIETEVKFNVTANKQQIMIELDQPKLEKMMREYDNRKRNG